MASTQEAIVVLTLFASCGSDALPGPPVLRPSGPRHLSLDPHQFPSSAVDVAGSVVLLRRVDARCREPQVRLIRFEDPSEKTRFLAGRGRACRDRYRGLFL